MFNEIIIDDVIIQKNKEISIPISKTVSPSDLVIILKQTDQSNSKPNSIVICYSCLTSNGIASTQAVRFGLGINNKDNRDILLCGEVFDKCEECKDIESCNKVIILDSNNFDFSLSIKTFNDEIQKRTFLMDKDTNNSEYIFWTTQDL